ncbi:hypothetical protein RRG08_042587 [Elysia crispata]|uniref:Uncharacterized protein n=1 Tax=Elysia crispata TaxID=231223 RepID=A0AAE0XQ56_9GAST|nr:hypothetical protein RRG08_042587 [Elysia crispata]
MMSQRYHRPRHESKLLEEPMCLRPESTRSEFPASSSGIILEDADRALIASMRSHVENLTGFFCMVLGPAELLLALIS